MSPPLLALYAGVRGLIYLALLLAIGSRIVELLLARTLSETDEVLPITRSRLAMLARATALALACLIIARGALQVLSFHEPGDPIDTALVQGVMVGTAWGQAWLLQLAATLVLIGVSRWSRSPATNLRLSLVLLVIIWAQSGMGHAATNKWGAPVGRLLDSAHVIGAGLWLGTLAVLASIALPQLRGDAGLPSLARVVDAFSLFARAGVLMVVVSGLIAALVYAGSVSLLLGATWGRLLLIKLALMLGVLAVGWYNWRVVTPALACADPRARARLRAAIRIELLLAAIMLAITTMLVASPLPGES